ncbi:hypothetical protein [Clostridium sp. DJ247]|uniref:glycan biosynthesis hexose transferase WsfD n=1 Tax=Clostridium sp. DJ247 TaxID=2726188 RepID=UPI001624B07A|nr:hypothetical protein [Clostridium sp. DJ247]MBC2580122.1 hypothetical protein [Clostridium sp. DJ247]
MLKKQCIKISSKNYFTLPNYISLIAVITAAIISIYTLFCWPMPGVADQGDFQRVMSVTGLDELKSLGNDYNSHWFHYVVTQYKMVSIDLKRLIGIIPTTSLIYPITLVRTVSELAGIQYFDTRFLAIVYAVLYMLSLYMCVRYIGINKIGTYIFFTLLSLLILIDGNYLIWFNSLYGEPMMIVGLLLFISSILYLCEHIEKINFRTIFVLFVPALLFLGSKLQCFVALPFVISFIIRIALIHRKRITNIRTLCTFTAATFILIFYVTSIYKQVDSTCGVDTKYNSVFYGILKNSANPKKDLAVLGLPPDLTLDAGKHAYLPKNQYVKYVPWSDLTENEFNKKINNFKLLKFYLLNPVSLIKGMEYTSSHCFDTRSFLGKYEKSAVKLYTFTFKRFTLWSDFRNSILPKNLIFIILFYVLTILLSIMEYIKRKNDIPNRLRIELLWLLMIIGILQFPMPYIGNGEADTSKQLFLFNYTFDIILLILFTWTFNKIYTFLTDLVVKYKTLLH